MAGNAWVLGIDIGTTHVKAVALDQSGKTVYIRQAAPQMYSAGEGIYEQDPREIEQIVAGLIAECRTLAHVETVTFSVAMHTFMVVDEKGVAKTRSWTWMDRRSQPQAQCLRNQGLAASWYADTGCPVFSMSPAVKWLNQRADFPQCHPVSLKDWLLFRFTGTWHTDYSTAAASGMMDLQGHWDDDVLSVLGLSQGEMPPIGSVDMRCGDFVVGGTDGAMAHVGLAIDADFPHAVLSWGTSAAIRVTRSHVDADDFVPAGSFAYFMGPGRGYLLGQALSNAGNVFAWAGKLLNLEPSEIVEQGESMASKGGPLPVFVPYLFGERSPYWDEQLHGAFLELRPNYLPSHFAGAVVVALLALMKSALMRLEASTGRIQTLRVGSSLTGESLWGQLLADVLQRPLQQSVPDDASAWGAAKLGGDVAGWEIGAKATGIRVSTPSGHQALQDRVEDYRQRTLKDA